MAYPDDFAKQLSLELELPEPLAPDEGGRYGFTLGEALEVTIAPMEEGMVLSAEVGKCPEEEREPLFAMLLLASLFGQGTGRSVLGINGKATTILLQLPIPAALPYLEAQDMLEEFLNYAEMWRKKLAGKINK